MKIETKDVMKIAESISNMVNPTKQALVLDHDRIKEFSKHFKTLTVLPEVPLILPLRITVIFNHFLLSALEEALQLAIPAGIMQYNSKSVNGLRNDEKEQIPLTEIHPHVMNYSYFSFFMIIFLVACGISICCFFLELFANFLNFLQRRKASAFIWSLMILLMFLN